ncbi:hypothetical protein BXZ70DRAFT_956501 [Cristinia sonorae]|uniref:ER-bound oxygenase mpaB/mpaB'/Rubber oxygenase catalytic domain-containing protein n=1 Tax=Cristinia sonorae TaxID=1940300 RepID=A0A8K0UGN9_9AGAR|nr:hypothetical protein BXZ70DRAFT_956501 [Cristinia sonorae]
MTWIPSLVISIASYAFVVSLFRYRRLHAAQRRFKELRKRNVEIDPSAAQDISQTALLYDMPFISRLGAQVALFKTYGIPSIAALLIKTGELGNELSLSRRLTDTALLISSFVMCPLAGDPTQMKLSPKPDPRGCLALARMNWLHRQYHISNDDMLYTLSRFVLQPMETVEMLDWRPYSEEERECLFIMWQEIGRRMTIRNIPETLHELEAWSRGYEEEKMVPSKGSHQMAMLAIEHAQQRVPNISWLRTFIASVLISLLDERVRIAMMLPAQPKWVRTFVWLIFSIRAFVIKYLIFPRSKPAGYIVLDNPPSSWGPDGQKRLHNVVRRHIPWYYPVANDASPVSSIRKRIFGESPFKPGPEFKCEGYRIEELGPPRFEKFGHDEVFAEAEAMYGGSIDAPWAPHTIHCRISYARHLYSKVLRSTP